MGDYNKLNDDEEKGFSIGNFVKQRLPIIEWLPKYNVSKLRSDLIAGITVGLMVIPQGLAYANIAGLPPQYGLYSAFMGVLVYCFLGTAKDITLGPTAVASLMVASNAGITIKSIEQCISDGYDPDFCADCKNEGECTPPSHAIIVTMICGLIQLGMGLFSLGFLVDFISYPVISGFTSAAAITIAAGQVKHIFGLSHVPRPFLKCVYYTFKYLPKTKGYDVLLGISCVIILLMMKHLKKIADKQIARDGGFTPKTAIMWITGTARNAILVIICGLMAYGLAQHNDDCKGTAKDCPITLTGTVPSGLPDPYVVKFESKDNPGHLAVSAVVIALVGILESIAIGKAFAREHGYELIPSQEFIAIGIGNIATAFFRGYPITGSFSRTAVNSVSGVATQMGGVFTGGIVMLALAVMTSLFFYIPKAALAAIIMSAVITMVNYKIVIKMWKISKLDLLPWGVSFLGCLCLGIEYGIAAAVGVSLVFLLYLHARPANQTVVLDPTTQSFVAASPRSAIQTKEGVMIYRFGSNILFPNAGHTREAILNLVKENAEVKCIVFDMTAVAWMDFGGFQSFQQSLGELDQFKVKYIFVALQPRVAYVLEQAEILTPENVTSNVPAALIKAETVIDGDKQMAYPDEKTHLIVN